MFDGGREATNQLDGRFWPFEVYPLRLSPTQRRRPGFGKADIQRCKSSDEGKHGLPEVRWIGMLGRIGTICLLLDFQSSFSP